MEGIQFVVDERGEKTAVLIDLRKHAELWEDFYDLKLARQHGTRSSGGRALIFVLLSSAESRTSSGRA